MRKLGLWGGCAVLLLAVGLAAAPAAPPPADDDDDAATAGPNPAARPRDGWNPFITRVFGLSDKKPVAKPDRKDKDKDKDDDKKAEAAPPRPSPTAVAARQRALEEAKLRRRQAVCERLRDIARETHDDDLERKALQLDGRAWEVYLERTQQLAADADEEDPPAPRPAAAGNAANAREVKP
jgi:hypothetical protein